MIYFPVTGKTVREVSYRLRDNYTRSYLRYVLPRREAIQNGSVEDEVQRKLDRLALPRNKSVKTVLVYEGKLDPAVEEDGFFDFVVPADLLLRGEVELPGTVPAI